MLSGSVPPAFSSMVTRRCATWLSSPASWTPRMTIGAGSTLRSRSASSAWTAWTRPSSTSTAMGRATRRPSSPRTSRRATLPARGGRRGRHVRARVSDSSEVRPGSRDRHLHAEAALTAGAFRGRSADHLQGNRCAGTARFVPGCVSSKGDRHRLRRVCRHAATYCTMRLRAYGTGQAVCRLDPFCCSCSSSDAGAVPRASIRCLSLFEEAVRRRHQFGAFP